MLQAQNGHEAVDVEEALRYLRACHFSPTKALDIFKNYQVSTCHFSCPPPPPPME